MSLKNPEEFPHTSAYLRYLKEELKFNGSIETMRSRWNNGERNPRMLTSPPMSRSQGAKIGRKKSAWDRSSPAIPKK